MLCRKEIAFEKSKSDDSGFTLLEYCAGAAVVACVVWAAVQTMGGNISDLLSSIGTWASNRSTEVANAG